MHAAMSRRVGCVIEATDALDLARPAPPKYWRPYAREAHSAKRRPPEMAHSSPPPARRAAGDAVNNSSVRLTDVMAAAAAQRASLVPETAGYLVLAVADAIARSPLLLDDRSVRLTVDGDVELNLQGELGPSPRSTRWVLDLLASLLSVSAGTHSGLRAAAEPVPEGDEPLAAFVLRVESALIPMNRAAGKRALARLARETLRARSPGLLAQGAPEAPPKLPHAAPPPRSHAAPPSLAPLSSTPHAAAPEEGIQPAQPPAPLLPRPASPGERRLEALHATRARVGLLAAPTWVGFTRWPEPTLSTRRRSPIAFYDWHTPPAPSAASASPSEADEPAASPAAAPLDDARADEAPPLPIETSTASSDNAPPASPEASVPLWVPVSGGEPEPAQPEDRRGVTMRFMFAADGAIGLLGENATHAASAELIGFIERTPSVPIDLPGSPTIAMTIEPYETLSMEPPQVGQTLPWPAIYPYDRLALSEPRPTDPSIEEHVTPDDDDKEGALVAGSRSAPCAAITDAPEPQDHASSPRDPNDAVATPAINAPGSSEIAPDRTAPPGAVAGAPARHDAPPAGPDRADELLLRFGASSAGETNMKAAAKGLRALAGIDLTPSMSAMPPTAYTGGAGDAPADAPHAMDDITPPATSPGPSSVRPPRAPSRGLARNIAAFAVGLAGATLVVHVRPSFPEDVIGLLARAIPEADSPSPPDRPPTSTNTRTEPRADEPLTRTRPAAAPPAEAPIAPPAHEPPKSATPVHQAGGPIDD